MQSGLDAYAVAPVADAEPEARGEFLRMVGLWVFGGLLIAYSTGAVAAAAVLALPQYLDNNWVWLGVFWGSFFFSHYLARAMVASGPKLLGFVLGCASEGIALGYLMLIAAETSVERFGATGIGPFALVAQAGGLTILTTVGMTFWLWTAPKNLSWIPAVLCVLTPPMLGFMVFASLFPIGGLVGAGVGMLFVAVSAAGLLYNLNQVFHVMSVDQHLEAAYEITLGILVLFWNILVTLINMNRE